MQRLPLPAAAVAATIMLLVGCGPKGGPPMSGPGEVGVVVVRTEPVVLTQELSGRTSAYLVSEVRPQIGGLIKARLFQEGAYVRAGQPLYQIDPASYQASYSVARAGLAQAEAAATAARLKAGRYKDLVAINAVSKQDNDDAQSAAQQAAANVQAQRAAVDQARINLGYTRVTAPISGRIGKSSVTPGALVTASQPVALATVQNLDRIYVDVTQSMSELLKLRREMASGDLSKAASTQVTLVLDDGSVYPTPGQLAFSDVTVDAGTGSVGLRAVFPNPDGTLLPGMYVRARLATAVAANGILIPQASVARDAAGKATVMTVGADSKVAPRPVVIGQSVGGNWLVTAGLKPGDRVIVEGLQKAQPGAPVKAVPVALKR